MKIRNRIAFIFIVQIAILEILIFALIYFLEANHYQHLFFEQLQRRVTIAAQTFLEKDESNIELYNDIRQKHLQTLPEEKEYFFDTHNAPEQIIEQIPHSLPVSFLNDLSNNKRVQLKSGKIYFAGMIYGDNQGDFFVILSARDLNGEENLIYLLKVLVISFVVSLIILILLGGFFAHRTLDPINQIIQKANSIRASNLNRRLPIEKDKDELSDLARTFNRMLDRIETSFELQGNFINNASHELKNPLTAILGKTEIALMKERSQVEYQEALQKIENEALRLDALINVLLSFAKTDQSEKGLLISSLRMDEILLSVKGNMDLIKPENQIEIDLNDIPETAKELMIQGNEGLIKVAINNILDNACKYSDNQKVVAKIITENQNLKLIISDQGIGIPPDELEKIRQPFYRAANVRTIQGFGFGLSLTHKIMKLHRGQVEINSESGHGTTVILIFPLQDS